MYARYAYIAGATPADILADFCAILCGTTDKSTLSAACDQVNTEIHFGINPATWVMHDTAASASGKVLKQRAADNSCDKFLYVSVSTTGISAGVADTWNATTHTGTGTTKLSVVTNTIAPATTYGLIILYSDPCLTQMIVKNGTTLNATRTICLEFQRLGINTALSSGYPNYATGGSTNTSSSPPVLYRPRLKNPDAAGDTFTDDGITGLTSSPSPPTSSTASGMFVGTSYRGPNDVTIYPSYDAKDFLIFTASSEAINPTGCEYIGKCNTSAKVMSNGSGGACMDETIIDSITYVKSSGCADYLGIRAAMLYPKG